MLLSIIFVLLKAKGSYGHKLFLRRPVHWEQERQPHSWVYPLVASRNRL